MMCWGMKHSAHKKHSAALLVHNQLLLTMPLTVFVQALVISMQKLLG